MVNDTACKQCPYKEKGFKECPNYIETIWQEEGNPQPKIVKDCAPRRSLLLLQELCNKSFALQKQTSQMEGEIGQFTGLFTELLSSIEYKKIDPSFLLIEGD